jgi:hypothetical protein
MLFKKIICFQLCLSQVASFSSRVQRNVSTKLMMNDEKTEATSSRKEFLKSTLLSTAFIAAGSSSPANAVERAIGASEKRCREEGNCLEKFDIDGAVGWNWGGRDRCDASDPRCGLDGQLMESAPTGEDVPKPVDASGNELKITNIAQIEIAIGKKEKGTLTVGLYGDASPASVAQFLEFLSDGIVTTSKLMLENGYGVSTAPILFPIGGNLNVIYPKSRLDFGIVSQGNAYARGRNLNRIPEDFVPQPRPNADVISKEASVRTHSTAGLLSIPKNGLGYGGSGYESDDEAFASSFQITADNVSSMDRESRKVIGQLMDESSMAFLARLASTPTRKGLKGIIPGQNAGPPLVKTSVTNAIVQ